ncbi:MAG: hypothetical protein QOG43_1586 [Actinomycetota bacterium]|jgi:hypothetical protein|nr:hypothetical protein [Actinomycetota bacterium]
MLERLPERARTPAMARAIMAPSSILLAGAGTAVAILAGVPLAAAAAVGAVAWAGKVAWAIPRKAKRPGMNPATVKEPWRSLVRQTVKAEDRFNETVRETRPGPLRDRLAELSAQVSVAVDASWQIAQRGDSLDDAVRELDADSIAAELAAREDELRRSPGRPQLEATVAALRRQLESAQRVADVARDALDRLRKLNAQLNETVARAVELSLGPADVDALQPLGADIDGVVTELESLRLALEESATAS